MGPLTIVRAIFAWGQLEDSVDSFEWNKIAGWVLTASIAVLGLSIVTGEVFAPEPLEKQAYVVEGVEVEAEAGDTAATEKPIAFYLASASVEKGEAAFKKCAACHTINSGGANGIGPNLYGVVGRTVAGHAGFAYSGALKEKGGNWTFDTLNEWLKNPRAYAPGNKMSFAGLSKPEDRAAVIAYLNQQSASPQPLPAVPAEVAAAAPAEAAPAGPGAEPTGDKPAVLPGKAPDVPEAEAAAAKAQPQGNVGGPGAEAVTGRAGQEKQN